jgi:hypothetical protein
MKASLEDMRDTTGVNLNLGPDIMSYSGSFIPCPVRAMFGLVTTQLQTTVVHVRTFWISP